MRGEREVDVVAVPTVERLLVEADLLDHAAAAGDEQAVEHLHLPHDAARRAEDGDVVAAICLGVRLRHLPEEVWWAGEAPDPADDAIGAGDADEIELRQVPLQLGGEIRREDLDVVVA